MIKLTILGEPVAKGRPKISTRGGFAKAYTPEKTQNYENLVRCSFQYSDNEPFKEGEELSLNVRFYFPIPKSTSKKKKALMQEHLMGHTKRPDIDNCLKSLLDGLNGVAFHDDSQIVSVTASKYYDEEPRTCLEIYSKEELENI